MAVLVTPVVSDVLTLAVKFVVPVLETLTLTDDVVDLVVFGASVHIKHSPPSNNTYL